MRKPLFVSLAVLTLLGAGFASARTSAPACGAATYLNPVLNEDFADPSLIKGDDGFYYAFATGSGSRNLSVSRSKNLIDWSAPAEAMPNRPAWASEKKQFWAPHLVKREHLYYLFFAASPNWAMNEKMRIGVATAANPAGPFVPQESHFDTGDAEENIDPMVFTDPVSKKTYLTWGRNGVIAAQELRGDLTGFAEASTPQNLLGPGKGDYEGVVEAPFVHYHNGYYYLFYSGDDCCVAPHYAFLVSRSKSLFGPYERLSEVTGRRNGAVVEANDHWLAPGHGAIFVDDSEMPWLLYHMVDPGHQRDGVDIRRVMGMDRLFFRDGWPALEEVAPTKVMRAAPLTGACPK